MRDKELIRDKRVPDKISTIVSLYNFADSVESLYGSLIQSLEKTGIPFEVVFIDDGSTDTTFSILEKIAHEDRRIRVVRMRTTFGEASALEAGLRFSDGDCIVFLSGRVRVNTMEIPEFLEQLSRDQDLIVGWRSPRRDYILNRLISWIFNWMVSRMSKVKLHDINSGIIVTRRAVLEKISYYGDLCNFIPVMAGQQGYRVSELKIEQLKGSFRRSRYPREYVKRFLDIITVFFLSRYSKKPIHFLGFMGTILVLAGMGIEIYLFIYRIFQFGGIAGRPLLVLGALLLVIGIQMISIGLLGEMLIFTHAGEIEEYNIEEIINE
jgi:glycosyltransferase involved in cell wall biosynthesis